MTTKGHHHKPGGERLNAPVFQEWKAYQDGRGITDFAARHF